MKSINTIFLNLAKKLKAFFQRLSSLESWQTETADYIVEEGTSGIWTYRKWASGIAECWGTQTEAKASYVTLNNNWYGYYTSEVALPFTFLQTPNVNASMKIGSNLSFASPLIKVSTTAVCSYGMAYGVSSSVAIIVN